MAFSSNDGEILSMRSVGSSSDFGATGDQNVVGDQVRRIRSERAWSQEDLARRCNLIGWDISRSTLSKIEAKLRLLTDAETFALAFVLDVELAALYPHKELVLKAVRNPDVD